MGGVFYFFGKLKDTFCYYSSVLALSIIVLDFCFLSFLELSALLCFAGILKLDKRADKSVFVQNLDLNILFFSALKTVLNIVTAANANVDDWAGTKFSIRISDCSSMLHNLSRLSIHCHLKLKYFCSLLSITKKRNWKIFQ